MTPAGYVLRPPTRDELPQVQLLLDAVETDACGEPCRYDTDVVVMAAARRLDLERDAWVVVAFDGSLAGCAWLWPMREGDTDTEFVAEHYVHPAHRDGAVDDALIDAIEGRVTHRRAEMPLMTSLVLNCEERDARRRASLQARGYEHVRDFYSMRIDVAPGRPPASWPAGIEVRPIRPGVDDRAAHAASEEAFAEHYLFGPQPFEEWRACTLERNECDPSLWLLAWDGGEVAGQVWALARDEGGPALAGLVEDLSVRKPWRGQGLGLALLGEVFRLLGERGCAVVRLWVDAQNTTGALQLYERAGMRQERHVMDFERPLPS